MESVCWSCARGRALPDPQGCGWIRSGGQEVPDGAKVHTRSTTYTNKEYVKSVILSAITFCPNYVRSVRNKVDKREYGPRKSPTVQWQGEERLCIYCGRPIPKDKQFSAKFCSVKCRSSYHEDKQTQARKEKAAQRPDKVCKICGAVFNPPIHQIKCCSPECVAENQRRNLLKCNERHKVKSKAMAKRNPVGRGPNEAIEGSRDIREDSKERGLHEPIYLSL